MNSFRRALLRSPQRLVLAVLLAFTLLPVWPIAPLVAASCQVTSALDDGNVNSLRAKLLDPTCDTITFTITGTINVTSALPTINRNLTLTGPGAANLTVKGNDAFRLLTITTGTVQLNGVTLSHGEAIGSNGGNLRITGGTVALNDVTLTAGSTDVDRSGGGAYVGGGNVTMTNVRITDNTAIGANFLQTGAGLYVDEAVADATVTLTDCTITGNTATARGGGGLAVVRHSGVAGRNLAVTLTNTTVGTLAKPNTAAGGEGGGIYNEGGTLTLTNTTVSGNQASSGSGIVIGNTISGKTTSATLTNVTVSGNQATGSFGGGIWVQNRAGGGGAANLTLINSTVSGNKASRGGGVRIDNQVNGGAAHATLNGVTVSGNQSIGGLGGGIDVVNAAASSGTVTATLTNSTVSGNQTDSFGGGIFMENAAGNGGTVSVDLNFVTVTNNTADSDDGGTETGGGIAQFTNLGPSELKVNSSIVAGNHRGTANTPQSGQDCEGTLTSQGHNIFGGSDCGPQAGTDKDLTALNVAVGAVLSPTLANNGGPTQTHALVANSIAIGKGDGGICPSPVATDQRGNARPQGSGCDSGAYEFGTTPTFTLTTSASGPGTVTPPTGSYPSGTVVNLAATANSGAIFTGWTINGVFQGWATALSLTLTSNTTAQASFATPKLFPDVGSGRPDALAITALATRGYIKGFVDGTYGPDQGVLRAQMAALIARATLSSLAPAVPGCVLIGGTQPSWDCEVWTDQNFTDQGEVDDNLWRDVRTLAHYQVANGFGAGCVGLGQAEPCFGPELSVTYGQTISFITRAMKAKGYWVDQPGETIPYPIGNVPPAHLADLRTFYHYTKDFGAVPNSSFGAATEWNEGQWNSGATRGWFAMALWNALNSYWSVD